MPGGNPVFDRLDKTLKQEGYAGFGSQRGGSMAPPAGAPYAAQDQLSSQQLQDMYSGPSAGSVDTGRVSLDDVIVKSLVLFAIVVGVGAFSWITVDNAPGLASPLWLGGMLVGLALGFAIAFMKKVSVPLIVVYAAAQGAFLGAFSNVINSIPKYNGVIIQAVLATVCTFVAMYIGYATGFIKVTSKTRRMFFFAIVGYMIFSLLQLVLLWTGVLSGWGFGGSGALGIGLSLLGVGLAAWSLAFDFDSIDNAISSGAPKKYSWLLAHGLIVSLVWLYIEFVRLFARLRD